MELPLIIAEPVETLEVPGPSAKEVFEIIAAAAALGAAIAGAAS